MGERDRDVSERDRVRAEVGPSAPGQLLRCDCCGLFVLVLDDGSHFPIGFDWQVL